jgi:hypothetical protein
MAEEQVTTKARFLELQHTLFSQLSSLLARFTNEQKTTLNVFDDWTLKDVMAHIASWHQDAIEVLDAALHNREPQIPIEIDWDYIHKRNAGFYQQNKDKPLVEVEAVLHSTYAQIIRNIEALSEEALLNPEYFPWMRGRTLARQISGDTYEHYQDHIGELQKMLEVS